MVDIAVAFVMGGAFGKVVTSFTEGVVSPLIGLIGGADLTKNVFKLKDEIKDEAGKVIQEAVTVKKKEAAAPAEPSSTDKLLTEIRDALKK